MGDIDLNFGEDTVKSFAMLDEGMYNAYVDEISIEDGKKGQYLKVTFGILDEPFHEQKRKVWQNLSLTPQSRWKLKEALEALTGKDWDQDGMKLDINGLLGLNCKLAIYQDTYTDPKTGKEKLTNKIDEILPSASSYEHDMGFNYDIVDPTEVKTSSPPDGKGHPATETEESASNLEY